MELRLFTFMSELRKSIPAEHEINIFGSCDVYLKKIERSFGVDITEHNGALNISGADDRISKAGAVIDSLLNLSMQNGHVTEQQVDYAISLAMEGEGRKIGRAHV